MGDRWTTARARELGAELRRLRAISEINLVHFAAKAGAHENEYWADARLARQGDFTSQPSVFLIHEQALRLPVGGGHVMNEQLLKLALLVDQPGLSIRVVPVESGAQSVFDGEFVFHQYAVEPVMPIYH